MRLWIDEDLSPSLVATARAASCDATCVRDRARLSAKDWALAPVLLDEEWVLVTNNAGDFLKLAERAGLHPGLIFVELGSAAAERGWLQDALRHIEQRAVAAGQIPAVFMINRVVEVNAAGTCSDHEWPPATST